jgi:hypothetical protein
VEQQQPHQGRPHRVRAKGEVSPWPRTIRLRFAVHYINHVHRFITNWMNKPTQGDLSAMRHVVANKQQSTSSKGSLQLEKHPNKDAIIQLLPPSWYDDKKVTHRVYLNIYEILGKKAFENIFVIEPISKSRSVYLRFRP